MTVRRTSFARLVLGLALVFVLFQWVATRLGSDRGQAGVLLATLVVLATALADCVLLGESPRHVFGRLGLGVPAGRGLLASVTVGALLLLTIPGYMAMTGSSFTMYPGWLASLPGLFAQAGIAEEILFRGYLFRRVREGRTFWRAALVASGPFVLVHLWLFLTMAWPIALASVVLAALISLPLAHAFELGARTIWGPALIHWVVQGAVKIVVPVDGDSRFALVWIAASAVIPFVIFLYYQENDGTPRHAA